MRLVFHHQPRLGVVDIGQRVVEHAVIGAKAFSEMLDELGELIQERVFRQLGCFVEASCDPTALSGFNSAAGVGTATQTVSWSFTGGFTGQTFEWDCDTDGGLGITGDSMRGMVVTITLSDSTVLTGVLSAVGPGRSELNFF